MAMISHMGRLPQPSVGPVLTTRTSIPDSIVVAQVVGVATVNAADYLPSDGGTVTATFIVDGNVSAAGLTGTAVLYDLTNGVARATLSFTEMTPTKKTAAVVLAAGAQALEVRLTTNAGTPGNFYAAARLNIVVQ